MTKNAAAVLLFVLAFNVINAQSPEEKLEKWSQLHPIEKVYLHLDRENYSAGETAWFKAYLYSDYIPDTISTTLYLELISDASFVHNRKVLPVLFGATNGHFDIPDSLVTGTYYIRAWTPTMLNQDPAFIHSRPVFIFGRKSPASIAKASTINLEFFPESGNMLTAVQNTIAFKATNEKGMPVPVAGKIFNDKNEEITKFTSYHDGMGMFDLVPSSSKYYALIDGNTELKYYLPASVNEGVSLTLIPHPQGQYFEVKQSGQSPQMQPSYMVGQMQHHVVFRKPFGTGKNTLEGVINTQNLHSGILQVTVFNQQGIPLAERLCFVNNKEYLQEAELVTDTFDTGIKARNRFHVKLKDTVEGNFSISVSDADFDLVPARTTNIFSQLLLSGDLRGSVHNPAYYFGAGGDSAIVAMDLLMMTNGWRRFKWTELPGTTSTHKFKDPGYINLSGKASLRDVKKPFDSKALLVYIVGGDSARTVLMTKTDKEGNFELDSLLFFGPAKIVFGDTRGKKSQYIDVRLSADSLTRSFLLPRVARPPFMTEEFIPGHKLKNMADNFDEIKKANGLLLEGVTIQVRKKSPIQELEEKYASGLFAGMSEKTYDLTNNEETKGYTNIFDYLQFRVPGLDVGTVADPMRDDYGSYVVYYRQGPSASAMGPVKMTIFLNEVETDANVLATISATDIAMVKVFSSFAGASGNAPGGVLAVYTKKGDDLFSSSSTHVDRQLYTGFSVIKEFYSPDYKADPSAMSKPDTRITLQWKPDIMVSGINISIPLVFYNNDRTKRFRVVVEGMTTTGKMVMIEKIIERKGF